MKTILITVFVLFSALTASSQVVDSVTIPAGVVYKYGDPALVLNAKKALTKELSDSASYNLSSGATFVGPQLWYRYSQIPHLKSIPNGDVTIRFNNKAYPAKLLQDEDGFKQVWSQLVADTRNQTITIRKATAKELTYYWAVISFDIDEPLLIAEVTGHRFLFNFVPTTMKLVWIDEIPAGLK